MGKTSLLRYKDDDHHWCPSVEGVDLPLVISFSFDEAVIITSMVIVGRQTRDADYFITSYSLSYTTSDDLCNLTQYKNLLRRSVSLSSMMYSIVMFCSGISQQSCATIVSFLLGTHSCPTTSTTDNRLAYHSLSFCWTFWLQE